MSTIEDKLDELQVFITETGKWVSYDYASAVPGYDGEKWVYMVTAISYRFKSTLHGGYLTQKFHELQHIYTKRVMEKEKITKTNPNLFTCTRDFSSANKVNIMSRLTFCKNLPEELSVFAGKTLLPEIIMREGVMVRDEWKGLTLIDWKYIDQIENF